MAQICPECGGATTWDDAVGSAVCTSCGTLTDPSQSVLTSQYEYTESSAHYRGWDIGSSKRTRFSNWNLADQGKEARDKRNFVHTSIAPNTIYLHPFNFQVAMAEFIDSIARSFNATGLSPRAMNLFRQGKDAMHFRWGRKAKLVAGACMAIALRESDRSDCLHDISFLLEEPYTALTRAYTSVTSALHISLGRVEPSAFIPVLHQHISSLLEDAENLTPHGLTKEMCSISLHNVSNVATSLSNILARIGISSIIKSPAAPIACAIFVLSLESELRSTVKQLAPLAQTLASRLEVGKGAVMGCYKAIQDKLASLAQNVPWLDTYESKSGRAKVAKRNVVARATKDIVTFYNDAWKGAKKPSLDITCEDDEQFQDQDRVTDDDEYIPPRKKRKTQRKIAMQFLLDPVTGPLPNSSKLLSLDTTKSPTPQQSIYPLLTYHLSAGSQSHKPTRLQLLAAARGGADEISDSELFEEDEMDRLLRSEEEMRIMTHLSDWGHDKEATSDSERASTALACPSRRRKRLSQNDSGYEERRSRINLEALARFLDDDHAQDDQPLHGLLAAEYDLDSSDATDSSELESETENHPPPPHEPRLPSLTSTPTAISDEEIIVDDWRPTSPQGGSEDRYGEVYD
ncbi:hypothetical protein NP233_g8462 [Leucocoprinus birnbaumii]|uniref:B-related factor 1 n=1 Tax=Leucocoprinus birnbaumii TaxID=56174 RepID=A0AAD5VM97_9AGAR|nr:hypothetical protein NP233_g8462 [Leucocoprinus birnbaumii]